jgi:hypothetical protein
MTSQLSTLSSQRGVPLSTLKFNANVLRKLELISLENHRASLTSAGMEVLHLLAKHIGTVRPVQGVS